MSLVTPPSWQNSPVVNPDRLTVLDASFLHLERDSAHMHVAGALLLAGSALAYDELVEHVLSRLHLVPRYRQRLAYVPFGQGRPVWVDDPHFNVAFHIRHTALPRPGGDGELQRLAGRVFSQALDRSRPLWELWLVEGLARGRFALLSKTHHALVDGISGVDIATVLFDATPDPPPVDPAAARDWIPRPLPSGAQLLADALLERATVPAEMANAALRGPRDLATRIGHAAGGLGALARAGLSSAPESPLNVRIGPHRRFTWVRGELAQFKAVKDALGGTVNDVVLAVVSGALARWLRSRGVRTEGLEMRALVPVSVRTEAQRGTLGNRLTVMRAPLPVYIDDAAARLRLIRASMAGLKESKQAVGAATLAAVNDLAPPTILAQASRLNFSTRLFNLLVTNVPGPQVPLYLLGRELQDLFPVAFLPDHHALAIAIMSYNGSLDFGLLADYDAMPDVAVVAEGIDRALARLLA
ncbi:MAG: WS/DGAT/MGAT family O-acyltransferase, partial [Solirubrobacteraceae bacterium]